MMDVKFEDFNQNKGLYVNRYIGMTCLLKKYESKNDSLNIELKLVKPFSSKRNINSKRKNYERRIMPFEILTLSLEASSVIQETELKETLKNNLEKRIGVTFFSDSLKICNLVFSDQRYSFKKEN